MNVEISPGVAPELGGNVCSFWFVRAASRQDGPEAATVLMWNSEVAFPWEMRIGSRK